MASPNLSEIVTTTLRNRTKKLADNVTDNNAALKHLSKRGKIKPVSGGRTIVQELDYAENGTAKWYSGYEVLDVTPQDVLSAAEFDFKQFNVNVTISGLEQLQNSGKDAIIDLLESRIENAERTAKNYINAGIYADGTGSNGKEMGGLQLLVADAPATGTVGGINRANYSFWRNIVYDASTDGGTAATAANIQSYMNALYVQLCRGTDKPDLILADNNYWTLYLESLQSIQRIQQTSKGEAGFAELMYMGAPVILDGGVGGDAPTNHMYMLNCNYLHFRPHRDRNFKVLDDKSSVNQDAVVVPMVWAGNMTMSNASLQGVLKA